MDRLKQAVRQFWEEKPCLEEVSLSDRNRSFSRELSELDLEKHAGRTVLDVGCGTGFEPVSYALHGANAVGLDMSVESLKIAGKRALEHEVPINWVAGDAEKLPFRDEAFDHVSAIGALHHTPNTEEAVREIHRTLKWGAQAVVMLYNRDSLHRLFLRLRGIDPKERYDQGCPLVKFFDRKGIRNLFSMFSSISLCTHGLGMPSLHLPIINLHNRLFLWSTNAIERKMGWAYYVKAIK